MKKCIVTPVIIANYFISLLDLRIVAMLILAFCAFYIKLYFETFYMKMFIKSSKTDKYRDCD